MSKTKVTINSIEIDITGEIEKITEKAGKDCASLIKQKAPRATGDYANGWTYEIENNNETVRVFNDGENKTLTHLLELGHRTKLGKGKGKRKVGGKSTVAPQEHIRPAYNVIKEQYLEDLKNINIRKALKK